MLAWQQEHLAQSTTVWPPSCRFQCEEAFVDLNRNDCTHKLQVPDEEQCLNLKIKLKTSHRACKKLMLVSLLHSEVRFPSALVVRMCYLPLSNNRKHTKPTCRHKKKKSFHGDCRVRRVLTPRTVSDLPQICPFPPRWNDRLTVCDHGALMYKVILKLDEPKQSVLSACTTAAPRCEDVSSFLATNHVKCRGVKIHSFAVIVWT